MKLRYFTAAAAVMLACCSCATTGSSNNDNSLEHSQQSSDSSSVSDAEQATAQPDPLAPTEAADETQDSQQSADVTSAESSDTDTSSDETSDTPADIQDVTLTFSDKGAVILGDEKDYSDSFLIGAAQAIFDNACRTEWNFTVGCPYETDTSCIQYNTFGWDFYLVTTEGINSIADIEDDYYEVFDRSHPSPVGELYIEKDGHVYALCGARGSNIFYNDSEVTDIISRSDSKIVFNVDSHYSGRDVGTNEAYTESSEFSVTIADDGSWHVCDFTLPY